MADDKDLLRRYINIINEATAAINEKWGTETKVSPEEKANTQAKLKLNFLNNTMPLKTVDPIKKDLLNMVVCVS